MVTGTGTGVGKTISTAALACNARQSGLDVAVCKPVQTGTANGDDDLDVIGRLSGIETLVGVARYPAPLAPLAAAEEAGLPMPTFESVVTAVRDLDAPGRLTLVEGAGGLLVELASGGATLRDLALELGAAVLTVVGPGLGTLNHTALTLEALENKGLSPAGLVIGSWPEVPGPAERSNLDALARLAPLRAVLPEGAGCLCTADFEALSARAFQSDWVAGLVCESGVT